MTWLPDLFYLLLGGVLGSSITVKFLNESARERARRVRDHDRNLID